VLLCAGGAFGQEPDQSDTSEPDYNPLSQREIGVLQSGPASPPALSDVSRGASAIPGGTLSQTPRRFQYNLSVSERTVYDDNINLSHSNRESDLYFAIEPTLSLGFGTTDSMSSMAFTYRPGFSFFIDHSGDDAI